MVYHHKYKAGDKVTVYFDPMNKTTKEGEAIVIRRLCSDHEYQVIFIDMPERKYYRRIY